MGLYYLEDLATVPDLLFRDRYRAHARARVAWGCWRDLGGSIADN